MKYLLIILTLLVAGCSKLEDEISKSMQRAEEADKKLLQDIRNNLPDGCTVHILGSYRRHREIMIFKCGDEFEIIKG